MLQRLVLAGCIAACTAGAQADVLGFRVGAYQWQQKYDGTVRSGVTDVDVKDDLGFDDESGTVFYASFDHPIPVIPNILIQHTELTTSADSRLTRTIDFDGDTYTGSSRIHSELDLTHTDATFYWRLLDNWVHLNLGVTARMFDGGVKIRSLDTGASSKVDIDGVLPMLYVAARFDLPFTGLSVGGDMNAIGYSDAHLYDARVNVSYETPIGLGAELGYRRFDFDYDDDGDHADATIDGAYLAVFYHF